MATALHTDEQAVTHLFIINPAAGSCDRTEQYRTCIDKVCSAHGLDYRIEVSGAPGECVKIARQAAETGKSYRIYACGGDGTLNEVVTGVVGYPNVAVTVFSGGSGNDFVRLFSEPEAFFQLERLLDCEEREFDLIRCNDDYAFNVCSVGLDARIGTDVASYKRIPLLHGFRAYAVSALINVIRGITDHYIVEVDGETLDKQMTMICVCNGQYYGGGFHPIPDSDPTDGLLDVLLVNKVSRWKIARVVGRYKNGRYAEFPKEIRHLRTKHLRIRCDKPSATNLDGELRMNDVLDISIDAHKIRFFYPKGLHW